MATPNTTDLDTELSAVNSILGSIGQSPITTLNFSNPEISYIYNLLKEANTDVQSEGWSFNKEEHVTLTPDSSGYITLPTNALQYDIHNGFNDRSQNVVVRNGRLYDKVDHTDVFTDELKIDITYLYPFGDLPQVFKRYVIYAASSRAAIQLVSNPQLVQLLQQKEAYARSSCLEYECNQEDPSFFGVADEDKYTSFVPFDALTR